MYAIIRQLQLYKQLQLIDNSFMAVVPYEGAAGILEKVGAGSLKAVGKTVGAGNIYKLPLKLAASAYRHRGNLAKYGSKIGTGAVEAAESLGGLFSNKRSSNALSIPPAV